MQVFELQMASRSCYTAMHAQIDPHVIFAIARDARQAGAASAHFANAIQSFSLFCMMKRMAGSSWLGSGSTLRLPGRFLIAILAVASSSFILIGCHCHTNVLS